MAAQAGLSVLVVEMEGKHGLAAAFGAPPLSYDHQALAPGVAARTLAEEVLAMLTDPARCRVILVPLPEETPVNEVVETAFNLEDKVGVDLGPVVVNGLYPPVAGLDADPDVAVAGSGGPPLRPGEAQALRAAAHFRTARQELQDEQLKRLADALPLPQLHVPWVFTSEVGLEQIDHLADALAASVTSLAAVES